MYRLGLLALCAGAGVSLVACGSAAAGTASSTPSPSAGGRGFARNGAAGQLVQINGSTLVLSTAGVDVSVTYGSSTTITEQSTGAVSDIVPGTCITATGQKDASGRITASVVRVSDPVNGACTLGGGGFGGGGGTRTPNPNATPPPGAANFVGARGEVILNGVTGTSVTLRQMTGATITITVPTTVRVSRSSVVQASTLKTGECVSAAGSKTSSGTIMARSITIVPAGPSGCFTGGPGGGGFGGGGFGGRGGFSGTPPAV